MASNLQRLALALFAILGALWGSPASASAQTTLEQARLLSPFGERAAFSPDGRRVAFVDKAYGNAFEIELASGRVRNLTGGLPHQGVVRIQYLENGDYLIVAPRVNVGANSRINLDLFVLDRNLRTGLQPLDQGVFEGVAIGPNNTIAWQQLPAGEGLRSGEAWMGGFLRIAFEHYVARIEYQNGRPRLVDRRRVMENKPAGCGFSEVQDFRDHGNEIVFYCAGVGNGMEPGPRRMGIYGFNVLTGAYTTYVPMGARYVEAEGVAPDGRWMTVECSDATAVGLPPLDICRLEMTPNGAISPLIIGTQAGSPRGIANSVVSPDGQWVAFQRADVGVGEPGAGQGVYLARVAAAH